MADPVAFVTEVLRDSETGAPFVLYDAQARFLREALMLTPDGRVPYPEVVFAAPKKSGKTATAALVTLYVTVVLGGRFAEGYTLANELEQAAGRVFQAIARIVEASPLERIGVGVRDRGRVIRRMLVSREMVVVRLVVVALVIAIGGPVPAWPRCRGASTRHTADFAARGPHGVGFHTLQFVDATRPTPPNDSFGGAASRTLDTQVWYPAAMSSATGAIPDAPLDAGGAPYPLVLYGHALMDNRAGEAYLAEHLASRGYVVAAVDFPLAKLGAPGGSTPEDLASQPGDLRVVLDHLLAGDGGLAGAIDPERVGASGLSLGAATVLLLTYHRDLLDPRIRAVLPIAPAFGCAFTRAFYRRVRVPLLVLQGDADRLAPLDENARRVVRRARGPRTLAVLDGGSHLGFIAIAGVLGTPASIDQFGCNAIGSAAFPPLPGGPGAGVVSDACAPPCQPPLPTPTLDFARQHDLTRTVAAAFFDAYLVGDQSAACWLTRGLAAENPDVETRRR